MKGKIKAFLIIILVLFFGFTMSSVLNFKLKRDTVGGYNISSIVKNATVSQSNIVTISEKFSVEFTDYNSCIKYEIPLTEDNYNIKVSDIEVISAYSQNKVNYSLSKENNNIIVTIKNNGYLGKDDIVVSYRVNKGEDYDNEKDSFNLVLFNSKITSQVKDFSFTITLPKVINNDNVTLLVSDIKNDPDFMVNVNSNVVTGIYKSNNNRALGKYTCLKINLENGYFKGTRNYKKFEEIATIIYYIITLIFFLIWFLKGKDQTIAAKPTFYPPENFNPLEVGYWIDGNVDYQDIFFMLIHWANEGYIKITKLSKQDSTNNKTNYIFKKLRELNINKPYYEKLLFKAIFDLGKQENVNDEFNTKIFRTETDALYGTLQSYAQEVAEAEEEFSKALKSYEIESYDKDADQIFSILKFLSLGIWVASMYIFGTVNAITLTDYMPIIVALITAMLAFFVSNEVFITYAIYASPILLLVSFNTLSVPILLSILLNLFFTVIVRKRTFKYNDLLGEIFGFRNVIYKDKFKYQINDITKTHANYFYDVLPYALILYKGKEWAKHFDEINEPDWYNTMDGEGLNKENIYDFIKDMEILCDEILTIVNLSATADKKKEAREGMTYVTKSERIKNAGLNPSTFDNDDDIK